MYMLGLSSDADVDDKSIRPALLSRSLARSLFRSCAPHVVGERPRDKSSLARRGEWTKEAKEGLALEKRRMGGELVLVWRRRVTNHLFCGRVACRVRVRVRS